jgi:hypothetical protein
VVQGDDLVVATHGRSFWILDDLTPLRQLERGLATADVHLYAPRLTHRTRFGYASPRGRPIGENPPDGAIISYYLKSAPKEKEEVTLEILDAQGKLVRKYTSLEKHETEPPPEWPEEEKPKVRLPAEAGMNRFAWDLRYEGAARIPGYSTGEYDDGLRGPLALPGRYAVRLAAAGKTLEAPLEIQLDPRVTTSQADLEKQLELRRQIHMRLTQISETVNQIRDLRAQLKALRKRLAEPASAASSRTSLVAAAEALEKKITPVEEELIQVKLKSSQDSLNYPLKVDGKLAVLAGVVESADTAPTQPSYELFDVLSAQVAAQLARWNEIVSKDVPALNDSMRKENTPLIWVAPANGEKRGGAGR